MNAAEKLTTSKLFGRVGTGRAIHVITVWRDGQGRVVRMGTPCGSGDNHSSSRQTRYIPDSKKNFEDVTCKKCLAKLDWIMERETAKELQVEETAQAANDAAGESEYAEVVAASAPRYVVGKRTNEYCWYVWDNEESEEASKNIWDESEAQKRADEMNANDPVQLKKQNESLLEENHALHSEIQALKIQLAEKDKRIEELDTAIIRYRDYALNLQYALKRAGLSIEVDNVPAPVAGEAAQDGEVLMTDATWPTLFSSEIDWLARNILLAKESHAFTFYNSTDAADLVGRVTHNLHTCIMLNSEYDTPANRAAIANRRKELGL